MTTPRTDVILLGTAGWAPTDVRETACVYLRRDDHVVLLDAGTGVRRLLTDPELTDGVRRVDVLLSHFHLDHVVGLAYLPGLGADVDRVVWGPGETRYGVPTRQVLDRLIGPPLFAHALDASIAEVDELPIGAFEVGSFDLSVRAQDLHTQPSVGFRFGDHLAYCTDTGYDPGSAEFARGCRHLLHEAFYVDASPDNTHSTPEEAARVAAAAGVEQLTLLHLDPKLRDEPHLLALAQRNFSATDVGRDLARLPW